MQYTQNEPLRYFLFMHRQISFAFPSLRTAEVVQMRAVLRIQMKLSCLTGQLTVQANACRDPASMQEALTFGTKSMQEARI